MQVCVQVLCAQANICAGADTCRCQYAGAVCAGVDGRVCAGVGVCWLQVYADVGVFECAVYVIDVCRCGL